MKQDASNAPDHGTTRPYRLPGQLLVASIGMLYAGMALSILPMLGGPQPLEPGLLLPIGMCLPCLVLSIVTAVFGPASEPDEAAAEASVDVP